MWLKNLVLYRAAEGCFSDADALNDKLAEETLQPCGGYQMESRGWVAPHDEGRYVHQLQKHWLIALGDEQKILPATIIRQQAEEKARVVEQQQGRPVGRKQMREIRDQITSELMPRALARRRTTHAWIDASNQLLAVDTGAGTKAELFMEALRRSDAELKAARIDTQRSPAAAMAEWLVKGEAPGAFGIDQDLELRAADASKATVRYARHSLEGREIRDHISAGKTVVKLGLTWNDRISFVLTEELQLKRLQFLDILRRESDSEAGDEAERFDNDFALMTGELALLIRDLLKALGGEKDD
ncbi:MAG: recombination-associated protein RdgC [Burkholderiales bacterium]